MISRFTNNHAILSHPLLLFENQTYLQGDTSGCLKPPVDSTTKVAFQYMGLILKRNFCFDVNRRLETT